MESVSTYREERIAAEAVEWIDKLQEGSTDSREAFADWITQSPDHIREFLAATAVLEELSRTMGYSALGGIVVDAASTSKRSCVDYELVARAVASLSDPCRRALTLRKVFGLSQQEIAARLGISHGMVESQLSEASWKLAGILEDRDTRPG